MIVTQNDRRDIELQFSTLYAIFYQIKAAKITIFTYIIFSMQRAFCTEVRQKTVVYLPIINLERHIMHQNVCLSVCYHLDVQYKIFFYFP